MTQELRSALAPGTNVNIKEIAGEGLRRARSAFAFLSSSSFPSSREDGRLLALASVLSPLRGLYFLEKKKQRPLIYGVLRVALKLPNDIADLVPALAVAGHELASTGTSKRV